MTRRKRPELTPEQARERRLEQYRAYNQSTLGRARDDRYEAATGRG
jgi:hypothetical protein